MGCRAQRGLEGTERNDLVGVNKVSLYHVGMDLLGLLYVGVVLNVTEASSVWLGFISV